MAISKITSNLGHHKVASGRIEKKKLRARLVTCSLRLALCSFSLLRLHFRSLARRFFSTLRSPSPFSSSLTKQRMSQKSTEQLCVDDVVEIDELKSEGPLSNKSETLFVNKTAKKFRKSGCPHYEKLIRIFGDTTATGVNACPSTRLISDSEDENENDVASNTNVGVEENDKEKSKKRVRRKKDEFGSFFSSFLDVYAENAKRKNDILEKRSFGCTSSQVDESQTSSKKDDLHEELIECLDILNTMEDVDGETYSKILKLLHGDLAWRKDILVN
uniref:L10-interacting MYB domain-containing protein-like n=1 Tax=Cucumis melo TaxID=3656 RepID=A0A9I9EA03_CUCME